MICPVCITTAVVTNLPIISASIAGVVAVKISQSKKHKAKCDKDHIFDIPVVRVVTNSEKTSYPSSLARHH